MAAKPLLDEDEAMCLEIALEKLIYDFEAALTTCHADELEAYVRCLFAAKRLEVKLCTAFSPGHDSECHHGW